jgi:hypothetical protein
MVVGRTKDFSDDEEEWVDWEELHRRRVAEDLLERLRLEEEEEELKRLEAGEEEGGKEGKEEEEEEEDEEEEDEKEGDGEEEGENDGKNEEKGEGDKAPAGPKRSTVRRTTRRKAKALKLRESGLQSKAEAERREMDAIRAAKLEARRKADAEVLAQVDEIVDNMPFEDQVRVEFELPETEPPLLSFQESYGKKENIFRFFFLFFHLSIRCWFRCLTFSLPMLAPCSPMHSWLNAPETPSPPRFPLSVRGPRGACLIRRSSGDLHPL